MILSHILAVSDNDVIGHENKLLWHIPEDLRYFKKRTLNKIMIMGRKTYDSIGGKPLPKRFHIVISRSIVENTNPLVQFVSSISEAYSVAEKLILLGQWPEEVMIVGGAEIYKQTLKDADFLYITRVPGDFEGDAKYPMPLPIHFGLAFSQFSEEHPGVRYEIWSRTRDEFVD